MPDFLTEDKLLNCLRCAETARPPMISGGAAGYSGVTQGAARFHRRADGPPIVFYPSIQ
jgi:hypothetical protein